MCEGAPSITTVRVTQRAETVPVVRFCNKPRMSMTGPGTAGAVGVLATVLVVMVTIEPFLGSFPLLVACPCGCTLSCCRSGTALVGLLAEKLLLLKKPGSETGIRSSPRQARAASARGDAASALGKAL